MCVSVSMLYMYLGLCASCVLVDLLCNAGSWARTFKDDRCATLDLTLEYATMKSFLLTQQWDYEGCWALSVQSF